MCSRDGHAENSGDNARDKSRSSSSKGRASNGDRVRDINGYRQRAAAFCARFSSIEIDESSAGAVLISANKLEVLLVSGRREIGCDNYWVLPGGGVESMESTEEAVVRELREEAGILGKILFQIGKFVDEQKLHHTTMYFLNVLEIFDEWENCQNGRERRWMSMEEARRSIKQNQMAMLEHSIAVIEQNMSDSDSAKDYLLVNSSRDRTAELITSRNSCKSTAIMTKSASLE